MIARLKTRITLSAAIALLSALILSISTVATANDASPFASTIKFLQGKFVGGQFVEGYTPGKPDWGFTVESMLQLKGSGVANTAQAKAIAYNLTSAANLGTPTHAVGFLYAPDHALLSGRAGEFLFAAKVFGVTSTPIYKSVLTAVQSQVSAAGVIGKANTNTFTYAWVTLGLTASGNTKLAAAVAGQLAALARPDGGFGTDLTGDTTTSATDATSIALLAFKVTSNLGSASEKKARSAASTSALAWLATNAVGDHFEAWGDIDVNGTDYTVMALSAWGKSTAKFSKYLVGRIGSDGGITTPWSAPKGDTFATAQGLLALSGRSYLDLLKK